MVRYMSAEVPEYQGNMGRKSGFSLLPSSCKTSLHPAMELFGILWCQQEAWVVGNQLVGAGRLATDDTFL